MKDIARQCTTLKQSKKLIELGFTKDSASLMWRDFIDKRIFRDKPLWMICFAGGMHPVDTCPTLPCWTCIDMIELIYPFIESKHDELTVDFHSCTGIIIIHFGEIDRKTFGKRSFRDNLFDCLVWLKENKYL